MSAVGETRPRLRAVVDSEVVAMLVANAPAARPDVLVRDLHAVALAGAGGVEQVQAACLMFTAHRDLSRLASALDQIAHVAACKADRAEADDKDHAQAVPCTDDDTAYSLQLAEVKAASRRLAAEEEGQRAAKRRRSDNDLQVAMLRSKQQQESEDFNMALNLGRPPGPWLADHDARRSRCGLPGCVSAPQTAHQGFCSERHRARALERNLLAPPSDEIERCFAGPNGDFCCLLLTKMAHKRAEIIRQFLASWKKPGKPRVEHVYEIVPPPHVRERFDRILSAGFSLSKAGTGPNRALLNLRYGAGIYFSATSGKSNDYAGGSQRTRTHAAGVARDYRVMIVASVAAGKAFVTQEGELKVDGGPPAGYHSIVGEPGKALNFDELVVYTEEAAVPESLIVYSL